MSPKESHGCRFVWRVAEHSPAATQPGERLVAFAEVRWIPIVLLKEIVRRTLPLSETRAERADRTLAQDAYRLAAIGVHRPLEVWAS